MGIEGYGMLAIGAILAVLVCVRFAKGILKSLGFSLATGWGSMALVNLAAAVTGVGLPVNLCSLAVSGVLGLPGVVLLFLMNLICAV